MKSDSNQIIENGPQNSNIRKENIEEEKNNEDGNSDDDAENILLKQKEQEAINLRKARRQVELQKIVKTYDDFFNSIVNKWETDKNNFEQFFEEQILKNINIIINQPCIVLIQDRISFSFKFLYKYFSFLKDNLKEIPLNAMQQACYIYINNLFNKTPNINNINNQIDPDNYDLIGDKLFFTDIIKKSSERPENKSINKYILLFHELK